MSEYTRRAQSRGFALGIGAAIRIVEEQVGGLKMDAARNTIDPTTPGSGLGAAVATLTQARLAWEYAAAVRALEALRELLEAERNARAAL